MLETLRRLIALGLLPEHDRRAAEKAADATGFSPFQILSLQAANVPVYTDMTIKKAVREGYKISIFVYRAVRVVVQAASGIPWVVLDKDGEVIPGHPFSQAWAKPNKEFSGQDNMEFIIAHKLLCGNALLQPLIVRGTPKEFWVVMPDLVRPIPSDAPGEWLKGWEVSSTGGGQEVVPADRFLHFMMIDPGNPYWGISPLMAAARTVDSDNEAQDSQKLSFQNRGTPDGVFTHDAPLTAEQFEEARRQVKETYLSKANRRQPWVLGAGAKWNQMSLTPVEMDFIASRLANLRGIAAAFGLDPWWLGDRSASTYNNVAEARRALYEDVVLPIMDDIKSTLNLRIAPMYGDITISYDTSRIPALREDFTKKTDQAKTLWAMGVPFSQINSRLEMGFNEFPNWDRGYLPLTLLPSGASPPEEESEEESGKATKVLNLSSEEAKVAHWKRIDRRRVGWWGVIRGKVEPIYKGEGKAVEEALSAIKAKAMTPRDWEAAYGDDPPHWAVDLSPSLFAQEFAQESSERELKPVLEIGCGNGRDSIFFARAGLGVTAIDMAPSAIKLAKENAKEAEVSIDFKVANAEKLPFKDEEFDAVFSLSVLHASDLTKSLPEVQRVLVASGLAFIYLYVDTQSADGTQEEYTTVEAFTALVKEVGFSIVDVYSEQEEGFDEFGEKHRILVALLERL